VEKTLGISKYDNGASSHNSSRLAVTRNINFFTRSCPLCPFAPLPFCHEGDGDTHGWLKVDAGFENLLNAGNLNDEGGNLVFEIICRFRVTQADAKTACQGYSDQVVLAPVGSHVKIVGRSVQDTFHAQWNEIHPVTSITVIP
jgi:hypothetical protein